MKFQRLLRGIHKYLRNGQQMHKQDKIISSNINKKRDILVCFKYSIVALTNFNVHVLSQTKVLLESKVLSYLTS